jgi:hypothetical protein
MVEGLQERIAVYRATPFDEKGLAWGKVLVIKGLEGHLGDPNVVAFLLDILGDTGE